MSVDFRPDDFSGRVDSGLIDDVTAQDLRVYLFAGTITPEPAQPTLVFASEITGAGGSLLGTSGTLQNVTDTDGLIDADDITIAGPISGTVTAVAIGIYTGNLATTRVARFFNTATAGLPAVLSAQSCKIEWAAGGVMTFRQA